MPRFIVKLTDPGTGSDYYLEWSTIVDAPLTRGMSLGAFRDYYREEYGRAGMGELAWRMGRVEAHGTSAHRDSSAEETVGGNRAGPGETSLSAADVLRAYCLGLPLASGWRLDDRGSWVKE